MTIPDEAKAECLHKWAKDTFVHYGFSTELIQKSPQKFPSDIHTICWLPTQNRAPFFAVCRTHNKHAIKFYTSKNHEYNDTETDIVAVRILRPPKN